ncbi:MAG: 1-phosphofructokinase [Anaerolineae bacterium]|nr:1-phosphofructokinase [Anaerolineae bacterium]
MIYTLTLNPGIDRELSVSEILFDHVMRASAWRVDWGGKGFNVSRLLKNMQTDSVALGFLGGKSGEMLRDGLQSLGISTDFVWVNGETRTNISIVAETPYHYIKVNEPGPTISAEQVEMMLQKVSDLAHAGDWWVLSGSLPPGVPADIYARLIKVIRQANAFAVLDCEGEALRLGCREKPFLVKPNHLEAEKLTGSTAQTLPDAIKTAGLIYKMGAENVVISMGEMGAVLVNQSGGWTVSAPEIQMRNPIGAGDSLVGGLVWGASRGLPVHEALKWGVACGAATASLSGTAIGTLPLVEELYRKVNCQPWNDLI